MLIPIEHLTGNIDTAKDPLERLLDKEDREIIERALLSLPPRIERIVRIYFGFYGNKEKVSGREIAEQLGVSTSRVNQLLARGLKKLSNTEVKKYLRQYVDRKMIRNFYTKGNMPAMHYIPEWKRPILNHINKYRYREYYDFDTRAFLQGKMSTKDLTDYFKSKE